jgi:DNA-directed RNA polymerase subunit RPC12/RpoP
MVTETHMACPACGDEVLVSGIVLGGDTYTLGDYGPPGMVFTEPVQVEDVSPSRCPYCMADITAAAAESLEYRAEAQWRD